MVAGDLYLADDPEVEAASRRAKALTERYNATPDADVVGRRAVLTELFGAFGADSVVLGPVQCDLGIHTDIGARVFANVGLVALDVAPITIGDDAQLGPNVALLTPTHPLDAELRRARWEAAEPIAIGTNAWLGGGVIVLPGVTIGADAVIGAGSVVTRDVPPGVLAVGNPARVIRQL